MTLVKVISGGQTGADRAALDAAKYHSLKWGGWCPKGRIAEDGHIPDEYFGPGMDGLDESDSDRYPVRTRLNVRDSDGTLCIKFGKLTRGTQLTIRECRSQDKPYFICEPYYGYKKTSKWICTNRINTLNVAGPRQSKHPGMHELARDYLRSIFYLCWLHDVKRISVWDLKNP